MINRAPNTALQQMIIESGTTYEVLARDICQIATENRDPATRANKSSIAQWISGVQPKPATARYLAEALTRRLHRPVSVPDLGLLSEATGYEAMPDRTDPVTAIAALGRSDVDRRTLLGNSVVFSITALMAPLTGPEPAAHAAAARNRPFPVVGLAEVETVRLMLNAFNAADERLGGGHGRSAVAEYLASDVALFLRGTYHRDSARRSMFSAAAQMAYLVGWKCHDLGLTGLAQRYYLRAEELAGEANPAQEAYCMRILAHQAMDLGQHTHCTDLADEALRLTKGKVDPGTESLFWLTGSRAHAMAGSRRKALDMLAAAERVITQRPADASPEWVSLGGSPQARIANQTGKTLRALGDLAAAEKQFTLAARYWNPTSHPRIHALTLAELAEVQCARGHIERACHNWSMMLDLVDGIQSARTRDAVTTLRADLAPYRGRGITPVGELDARAADYIRDQRDGSPVR